MTKKEKDILYDILEILINKQQEIYKHIEILQKEIKLLNKKINYIRGGKNVRN